MRGRGTAACVLLLCAVLAPAASPHELRMLTMVRIPPVAPLDTVLGKMPSAAAIPAEYAQLLQQFFLEELPTEQRREMLGDASAHMIEALYGSTLFSYLPAEELRIGVVTEADTLGVPIRLIFSPESGRASLSGTVYLLEQGDQWKIGHLDLK